MLMKIMCKSPDKKYAYAFKIESFRPVSEESRRWFLSDNPVLYIDNGSQYSCDRSDIVSDPVIIHRCAGHFYKIAL